MFLDRADVEATNYPAEQDIRISRGQPQDLRRRQPYRERGTGPIDPHERPPELPSQRDPRDRHRHVNPSRSRQHPRPLGQPRAVNNYVTPSFFELLGAEAAIGRTFTEEEGDWGSHDVVVLSHALWEQLYAGDPAVLGSDLRLDGRPYSVVGVMPKDFVFLDDGIRLWTALTFDPERRMAYHSNNFNLMARLKTGISLELAQDRIHVLNTANMDKTPELKPLLIDAGFHTPLFFLHDDLVRDVRANLYLLWGGVAFVLLIGGVNVANLSLVRSTARAKELATRFDARRLTPTRRPAVGDRDPRPDSRRRRARPPHRAGRHERPGRDGRR